MDKTISTLKGDFEMVFEDGLGKMQVHRDKTHDYIGMTLDHSSPGEVRWLSTSKTCVTRSSMPK